MDDFFDRNGGLSKLMSVAKDTQNVSSAQRGRNAMDTLGSLTKLVQTIMALFAA